METSRDMMFPEEIWEEIFKRIDDVDDLIKLQSVCLNFNKWIQRLLDRDIYWKKYCQDIPDECSYAILNKVFPDLVHDVDVSWQDIIDNYRWRKIYMSRKKWNSCLKRKPFIDSVKNFPSFSKYECITCTAVWDDILAVATSEGLIYFSRTYKPDKVFFKADHKEQVHQIKFWYTDNQLIVVTSSIYERIKYWNVTEKKEIDTNNCYRGTIISINQNGCYLAYNNYLILTKYSDANESITPHAIASSDFNDNEDIIATYSPNKFIIMLTINNSVIGRHVVYTPTNKYEVDDLNISLNLDLENKVMQKFYVLSIDVMIGLCGHMLAVSVDDKPWKVYNIFKQLLCVVTAIAFHANILILGYDSGFIHMFHLKSLKDLIDFDFTTKDCKKIKVDREPIISLEVTDIQDEQFVIASTDKNLHVIRFFNSTSD
ncbi:uncharacterized protein LOC103578862 [Microplitis demolitor]|uniref:uncharacterized protein LOC103578862 n=1 Tax=Microplitis demolitor TaxID=69319 RepID=UPI0004CD554D|nr:uncharacterized protein LOC103578862 [Microplitis demolitor]